MQASFNPITLSCFKAYDIRGQLETQLTPEIAYRVGRAYGQILQPKTVVVGGDVRESSTVLKQHLAQGLCDAGVDVIDLGMTGTEEVYFATFFLGVDGGIEVTASHNPIDYNGMKLVTKGAVPISSDSGLKDIQALAESGAFVPAVRQGELRQQNVMDDYSTYLMQYIDVHALKPMKIVINAGNGAAGPVLDALEQRLQAANAPIEFIKIHHNPDPTFPNGIPNPLLPENRASTRDAVIAHQADLGIAWDGDFDRCFFFDEHGEFVEGYYVVGLLAEAFLSKYGAQRIIHDPRLTWNTIAIVEQAGGTAIQSKTGHAFIKERMRAENAIYGGEMSGHHYFKDFAYCDSGMIPWLLVIELLCKKGVSLGQLLKERISAFPCSGEINFKVDDAKQVIERIKNHFAAQQPEMDYTDGVSITFADWRMSIRSSNTEPLLRLNIEAKQNADLVQAKVHEVMDIIGAAPLAGH